MSSIRVRAATAFTLLLIPLSAAGCKGGSESSQPTESLPKGSEVLSQASAAMRDVNSVGFTLGTEGKPAVPFKRGDIKLLKSGDAEGGIQIQQAGQAVEMNFVLVGPTVYLKGVTGGYQKLPRAMVAQIYDPSAVLDPDRGVAKLLTTATDPTTEAREKVGGKDTYRVKATLPKDTAAALVPGIGQDLTGQVWVATTDHRPVKLKMQVPPTAGGGDTGSVIVSLTEFNADYKITPPK
jgi:lipoprotein LprG